CRTTGVQPHSAPRDPSRPAAAQSTQPRPTTKRTAAEMGSAEIARRFLRFSSERGHPVVPSASLIAEAPTPLPVPPGMVPFKPYFLGQRRRQARRLVSVQKCIRTPDIDEVGKTTRHATFFQMLGNFSIGDYFKEQVIPYAWELLTTPQSEGGFGFAEDRLWVT